MNKLITTITIVALTSVALAGGASAGPGNPGGNVQIGNQSGGGGFQSPQLGGLGGFKLKTGGGGDTTSPGDAFYPDIAVGDPKAFCIEQGGTPVRRFAEGDFYWFCNF
jgi:hypothetical protein